MAELLETGFLQTRDYLNFRIVTHKGETLT